MKRIWMILLMTAASLVAAGFLADVTGRFARMPVLWTVGGHLLSAGLISGGLAWISGLAAHRRVQGTVLAALLLIAAARLLRGTAAVPPDPPLLVAECIGALLIWLAVRRASGFQA